MICHGDDCPTPNPLISDDHWFAGYGFYAVFCAVCCPRTLDGMDCEEEHSDELREMHEVPSSSGD